METNQPSLGRLVIGFVAGGLLAAVAAGLVFSVFFPVPQDHNRNHNGEGLELTIGLMFFSGGFIGVRGFNADALSDLAWPVIGSYVVVAIIYAMVGFSLRQIAPPLACFSTAGIVASAIGTLLLRKWFPPELNNCDE
jgi:hypothetical protein